MIEAKPDDLIDDRAYDSDPLAAQPRDEGIEMIAPHKSNHKVAAGQCRAHLAGASPAQVAASHGPGIEPCRRLGDGRKTPNKK